MTKKPKDPFAAREADKYENPIPSREFILNFLEEHGKPVRLSLLIDALGLDENDEKIQALKYRLRAMVRDSQVMQDRRNRYCLMKKLALIAGTVIGHPDGFGFLTPEESGDDLYLSPKEMKKVLHGDKVHARVIGSDKRGRLEGVIHEVIEHANDTIVGKFYIESGMGFVESENKRITQDIMIPLDDASGATEGQMVVAEMVVPPTKRALPIGKVVEILGDHMAPGMEIDVAIRAHGLPHEWPEAVMAQASQYGKEVNSVDMEGRKDLRDLDLVTIDGEDAKDFDDAVYCEQRDKGNWRLIVAIADVSHYVQPGSALDEEAYLRGTSVYFPGRVIPMLPKILSNTLCSLNPKVDRLCMSCDMTISPEGKLLRYRFYPAVMHSKARLTYTNVNKILVDNDKKLAKQYQHVLKPLQRLYSLYQVLMKARSKRGAIEFDSTDTKIEFDKNKKIKRIVPVVRNDAHRLIEECMLLANVAAARFLKKNETPILYRVHDKPPEDRLSAVREFLGEIGLSLHGGAKPHGRDYQQVLDSIAERPDRHMINTVLLRSMSQAVYDPNNIGHFGLAFTEYAHFTSPIRRYPDLLVHRAIKHAVVHDAAFNYDLPYMQKTGRHCSKTERRADDATRDVVSWLKCEFMLDKLGGTFMGTVSSVTSFGIFVELEDNYVEGLVHITGLKDDYYQFEPAHHRLIGERTRTTYHLGKRVKVKVARVDLDERKIDFELSE